MRALRKRAAVLAGAIFLAGAGGYASFEQQVGNARSSGFGGAFAGLADSSDAVYYNAGGLSQVARPELIGSYGKIYAGLDDGSDLSNGNLTVAYPLGSGKGKKGVLGVAVNRFGLAGYYSETMMGAYYSQRAGNLLSFGGGVKYLTVGYEKDDYTALNPVFSAGTSKSNVSFDVGALLTPLKRWSFGMAIRDINAPDMGLKYSDPVGQSVTLGGAYRYNGLNVASDVNLQGGNFKIILGGEKWFLSNQVAVRAGFGIGSRKYSRFNAGLGYEGNNTIIDYSFHYPLSGLSETYGTHKMSFGYRFGLAVREEIEEAERWYHEAVVLVSDGGYDEALKKMDAVLDLRPEEKKYKDMREKIWFVARYVESARADTNVDKAVREGIVKYLFDGEAKEAVNKLLYAYSLRPDNEGLDRLVKVLVKEHNLKIEEPAKTWNLAEQKLFRALEKFKEKKYDEVIKLCEEALTLEPNNIVAYKRLGSTFYILGNKNRAKANWLKVIELAPNDEEVPQIKEFLKKLE